MPDEKKATQTMPQKWHMALTDAANFGEKCVASDKDAMTAAWETDAKTEPAPVGMTRDEYALAADLHRAIATTYEQTATTDGHARRKMERHNALADDMCDIATRAWTPQKAHDMAVTVAELEKVRADNMAIARERMAAMMDELGLTMDDLTNE